MSSKERNNRRGFLKSVLLAGSAVGISSQVNTTSKQKNNDKIKMLTADGKLVEVDKSVLEKNKDLKQASNEEVFAWMTDKHKK